MQDARYYNRDQYNQIYGVLGGLGAVGAARMAYDVYKGLYGAQPEIVYPKKYKKDWQKVFMARKRKSSTPLTPPRTPKARRRVTARNVRQTAYKIARQRHLATISSRLSLGKKRVGKFRVVSGANKYLKQSIKQTRTALQNMGHGYSGGVGKTYKLKNTMEFKLLQKGALQNIEYKGVSDSGAQTVFLGHSNYPAETVYVVFWMAVMKAFMVKVGYPILDFSDQIPGQLVGDNVTFTFKNNYQAGGVSTQNVTFPAATTWIQFISANIRNTFIAKNNQFQLISLELNPAETSPFKFVRMWCKNAKVLFHSVSSMTFQNRTPPGVGNTNQDVIDNQPVKGHIYYGYGNGTQMKDIQGTLLNEYVPGGTSGVIDVIPAAGNNNQLEPPEPHFFSSCRRTGAVILDPGQSKTSVLKDTKYMTISSFFNYIFGIERVDNVRSLIKLGKHKIFSFEKIVDCVEAQPNINIGFEHNLRIGCVFIPGYNQYSSPYYQSGYK